MAVKLKIQSKQESYIVILKPNLTFGRSKEDADIFLNDSKVSSVHFQILFDGDEILVKDLGSKNGTHINGRRIEKEITLYTYDVITAGNFSIRLDQKSLNTLELSKFSRQDEPNAWGENISNIHKTLRFTLEEEKRKVQLKKRTKVKSKA